ncbi:carbonic anhydrase, partial [Streptomyces sp. NPDC056437]
MNPKNLPQADRGLPRTGAGPYRPGTGRRALLRAAVAGGATAVGGLALGATPATAAPRTGTRPATPA